MSEVTNGAGVERAAIQQPNANAVLDAQVRQVVGIVLRGLMVSAQGVPPHLLLNAICRQTGALAAGSLQGDLGTLLQLRRGFKEAFAAGVASAPVVQGAPSSAIPPDAAPRG